MSHEEQMKIWSDLNFSDDHLNHILHLYELYQSDLRAVRESQLEFYQARKIIGMVPQLCDIEAEINYLLIRDVKPESVIEISPASGWSTSWILHALKDNRSGMLYSFDLVDDSWRTIPKGLANDRWILHIGDVRDMTEDLPQKIDYVFLDSDHSHDFARWYIDHLFPLLDANTWVSIHDILKRPTDPGWGEESPLVCQWLVDHKVKCATASRMLPDKGYDQILDLKKKLHMDNLIHSATFNSMIFFQYPFTKA